jgi:chromosome segregation ATPase
LSDRDFLLSQAQEREEQLVKSKKSANNEITNLKEKIEKLKGDMKESEEKYEENCHKLIEENKKLKLESIEQESMINKYKLKLDSIEETLNDLKLKKSSLEDSNEKLEHKIKDMKMTINEYESANQQLDTKLMWAEKTYEEGLNKIMNDYERKQEIIQKQNQELLDKTQNERVVREEKIKTEMKEKIVEIQKGIEASNEEIKKLRNDKQKLLEENLKLTQLMSEVKITFDPPILKEK